MDYPKLINNLRYYATSELDKTAETQYAHWASISLQAADAIQALQRACANYAEMATEQEWIPVTERLPRADRAEQVLINLHYPDGSNEVSLGEHWNCPDIPEEDGWGGFGGNGVVTHWMPLPEPPKEEQT